MKKFVFVFCFIFCACPSLFAQAESSFFNLEPKAENILTVKEVQKIALAENTNLELARKNVEKQEQVLRQYYSYLYPQLSVSGTWGKMFHIQEVITPLGKLPISQKYYAFGSAEAGYLLWAGGAVSSSIHIAKFAEQAKRLELLQAQNKIKDTVNTVCYNIVLANILVKVQEESLHIAEEHLKEIKQKYSQGLANDLEVLNQEVKVSNTRPQLISAKNAYELGLLTLRRLLNKDPEEQLFLTWKIGEMTNLQVPSLSELYKIAEDNRPEITLSHLRTEIEKEQIKIASADNYGKLYAFAAATYLGTSDSSLLPREDFNSSYGTTVGLKFNLPLFEGFKTASIIKEKEIAYQQALLQEAEARKNIRLQVKSAWLNLSEAYQRFEATKGTVSQARKNLERTNQLYKNGLINRLNLEDSSLLLYNAELALAQSVHDIFTAASNLNYAIGKEVL